MAFDVNNAQHVIALSNEQINDPLALGYSAVDGITHKTLELFNDPAKNVGGQTGQQKFSIRDLLKILMPREIEVEHELKLKVFASVNGDMDADISDFVPGIKLLYPELLADIDAHKRPLNRVEVLFPHDNRVDENGLEDFVEITRSDWAAIMQLRNS